MIIRAPQDAENRPAVVFWLAEQWCVKMARVRKFWMYLLRCDGRSSLRHRPAASVHNLEDVSHLNIRDGL
jgi:hypothetical protein